MFYEPLKISVFHGYHGGVPGAKPPRAALAFAGHDRYKQFDLLISSQPINNQRLPSEFATPRLFVEY